MTKLDIIKYLISSIESELEDTVRIPENLKRELEKIDKTDKSYWAYFKYDINEMVNKSKIKNDLKMIRRLTLEIEKEL